MLFFRQTITKVFLVLFFVASIDVFAQSSCNKLPKTYKSYTEAIRLVREAKFSFTDSFDTSKSSFITSAEYYSCDNKTGYLILGLKGKPYICRDVPKSIWNEFKAADSFGTYFNQKIKRGSYKLH